MLFELSRGNERLECDLLVWWDTTELAIAFGWRPRSPDLIRPFVSKLINFPVEVTNEDAQSLAAAIRRCLLMLTTSQRLSRRQIARLQCLTTNVDHGDISLDSVLEPARIAKFSCKGGFRLGVLRWR
jgi:hypothetical protein